MNQVKDEQQNGIIGAFHYNSFASHYGSPSFLGLYKFSFVFCFVGLTYLFLACSFKPYPAFNSILDNLTQDNRVAFSIYWAPTALYLLISVIAVSDFLNKYKIWFACSIGVICLVWHVLYFIAFWAAPSDILEISKVGLSPSCGWYWSEIFINIFLLTNQILVILRTKQYELKQKNRFEAIQKELFKHFDIKNVQPQDIFIKDYEEQENLNNSENNDD